MKKMVLILACSLICTQNAFSNTNTFRDLLHDFYLDLQQTKEERPVLIKKWVDIFEKKTSAVQEKEKDESFYLVMYELALLYPSVGNYDLAIQCCEQTLPGIAKYPQNKRIGRAFLTLAQYSKEQYLSAVLNDGENFDADHSQLNKLLDSYVSVIAQMRTSSIMSFTDVYGVLFEYAEFLKLCDEMGRFKNNDAIVAAYMVCIDAITNLDGEYFKEVLLPLIDEGLFGYEIEYLAENAFKYCTDESKSEEICRLVKTAKLRSIK